MNPKPYDRLFIYLRWLTELTLSENFIISRFNRKDVIQMNFYEFLLINLKYRCIIVEKFSHNPQMKG